MDNSERALVRLRDDVLAGRVDRRALLSRGIQLGLGATVLSGLLAGCAKEVTVHRPTVEPVDPATPAIAAPKEPPADVQRATPRAAGAKEQPTSPASEPTSTQAPAPTATREPTTQPTSPPPPAATPTFVPVPQRGGGGVLRLVYWQVPVTLNPHLANGIKDFHASRICLEPLADLDSDSNGVLQLGAEWPTLENGLLARDGTWVTWKLRRGVKWHDGEDFNADDVIFTYEYIMNHENQTTTNGPYWLIDDIRRDNDFQITIHFVKSNPDWRSVFTNAEGAILPEHVFRFYQGEEARNAPANLRMIGTGPFKVREFRPGDTVWFDLFEDYWDPGKPYLDGVTLEGGGDSEDAARAVCQTGEADWAWNIQVAPQELAQIESGSYGYVLATPGDGTERLMIQFADPRRSTDGSYAEYGTSHPVWSDVRARKALSKLIPRDVIAGEFYGKGGSAASNQFDIPPQFTNPSLTWEYNPSAAQALLDSMGFNGADIVFQTTVNTVRQRTQELIRQALEPHGFRVELKSIPATVYFSVDPASPDTSGKFWADLQMHTNASGVYPGGWFSRYRSDSMSSKTNGWTGGNVFHYSNPEFDALHDECLFEIDPSRQRQLFQAMMTLVTETDVVEVPIVNRTQLAAVSNRLRGYTESVWAAQPVYDLKNVWMED